jgi:hypothetical protein
VVLPEELLDAAGVAAGASFLAAGAAAEAESDELEDELDEAGFDPSAARESVR